MELIASHDGEHEVEAEMLGSWCWIYCLTCKEDIAFEPPPTEQDWYSTLAYLSRN